MKHHAVIPLLFAFTACAARAPLPPPTLPLSLTVHAQFPAAPPMPLDTPAPPLPTVHTFALPNGLHVVVIPRTDANDVVVRYVALGGADPGALETLGHGRLIVDALEKTLGRDDDPGEPSLSLWNDVNATYTQRTSDPAGLARSFEMMAELLRTRNLVPEDVNLAASGLMDTIRAHHKAQGTLARFHALQMLFGDEHPLGHPTFGRYQNFDDLKIRDLESRLATMFSPAHSVLFVVGNVTLPEVEQHVRQQFGDLPAGRAKRLVASIAMPTRKRMRVRGLLTPGVVAQIVQAFEAPARDHPDYPAFAVLSMLLGGLSKSRMMTALRHRGAQTYGVHASYTSSVHGSTLLLDTQVREDAAADTLDLIDEELERLRREPVTAEELARAKRQVRERLYDEFETTASVQGLYSWLLTTRAADAEHLEETVSRYLAKLERVDASAVLRVAQVYLLLDHRGVTVSGPLGAFYGELVRWSGGDMEYFVPARVD